MASIFKKKSCSEYVSLKMDDSPSIIVGKLIKETSTELFVAFPIMIGFFANQGSPLAAMGVVQGVPDSDAEEDPFADPPEASDLYQERTVGILARKLQPFSKNDVVRFVKTHLVTRAEASNDMIAFCEQFQKKFGNVMEDSLKAMIHKMDPVSSKRLMIDPSDSQNLIDSIESSEQTYNLPETTSKMIH